LLLFDVTSHGPFPCHVLRPIDHEGLNDTMAEPGDASEPRESRYGLAQDYVLSCTQLFTEIVRGYRSENPKGSALRQLCTQAQRFSLWSDGFDAGEGGLDDIITNSAHVQDTVLMLLSALGGSLVEIAQELRTDAGGRQQDNLAHQCDQIARLNERLLTNRSEPQTEDIDSDDFIPSDSSSEPSHQETSSDPVRDIVSYNDLLSDLVPTLSNPIEHDNQNADTRNQHPISGQIAVDHTPPKPSHTPPLSEGGAGSLKYPTYWLPLVFAGDCPTTRLKHEGEMSERTSQCLNVPS